MSHAAFEAFMRQRRAEKQRLYNARARAKAKTLARPTARDVQAEAFAILADNAGKRQDLMMLFLVDRLVVQGYDEEQSWDVLERMVGSRTNVDTSMQPRDVFVDC